MYAIMDPVKYMGLSGYTEYHASQVELMYLLGAEKVTDTITDKNMNSIIATFPNDKTVLEYLLSKHQFVVDMMSRKNFPENSEALKTTVGVMYNYWGLRSICKMHLKDYIESVNNTAIVQILPFDYFSLMNIFIDGWFDKSKVEMSFAPYYKAIFPIIKEKNLI